MIHGRQGKMLKSLLEKPFNKIQLDRVIVQENGTWKLLNSPQEVLDKTKEHFQRQFNGTSTPIESSAMWQEWAEYFEPKDKIKVE